MPENKFWRLIENQLDEELAKLGYNLERAIDHYRSLNLDDICDSHETCNLCGYIPPFCRCQKPLSAGIVTCDQCEHFIIDTIGDGAGIGESNLGIISTRTKQDIMPLYRYTHRYCEIFSKFQN